MQKWSNMTDAHSDSRAPLLSAHGITKRFGAFTANDGIDLDIHGGKIHALLGENGAGKSTLVKICSGLLQPDGGRLLVAGRDMVIASPAAARQLGIGMVFQHFTLFDSLTVAENVALGLPAGESASAVAQRVAAVSREWGLPLDPAREVWRLSAGERQRIEIVRALMQNPKLLILDEPTSVLTPQEADGLFTTLRRLRDEGRGILYISHKLDEVKALCDTATILRGGRKVATCDPRRETAASLARMMMGADTNGLSGTAGASPALSDNGGGGARGPGVSPSAPRLVIRDLSLDPADPHGLRLESVSFDVHGGEIVGIAGVAGNGQDELFAALSGERAAKRPDTIVIDGRTAGHLPITERRRLGAAFVPEERLGHATAPRLPLSGNVLLTGHSLPVDALTGKAAGGLVHRGFIDRAALLGTVDRITAAFDLRKAKRDPEAASLSGGNLQKFTVGREILREPGVLVAAQPTWGVDAGAAATIRRALADLAARGSAVLVISQDLDELEAIAGRIAVMFRGRLSPPMDAAAATREALGLLMGGGG
jgi:simple sugar transport system ATP-binding protein